MNKIKEVSGGVCAAKGFQAAGVHCGIRKNRTKRDLALIFSDRACTAAAVYTTNKVKGAPIAVTRANIADGKGRAFICNSGNANTCNADGVEKAQMMCDALGKALSISPADVIVASTGVIGQPLPIEPILSGIPELIDALSDDGSPMAAEAIMTTDLALKEIAVEFTLGGKVCKLGAIAKGSGMIHPNMATMLGFITTDAAISAPMLQKALSADIIDTYNMVSVDGDTSTNDMVSILASGAAGNPVVTEEGEDYDTFCEALNFVNTYIAKQLAKDGEGATKLVICEVAGAPDKATAVTVTKSIVTSSLTKAAMFGADANWGRVLCAIGYAEGDFDISKTEVSFRSTKGSILVCQNGAGVAFDEAVAKEILMEDEITILVDLKSGNGFARAYGCDLTYDYVRINGDYRT